MTLTHISIKVGDRPLPQALTLSVLLESELGMKGKGDFFNFILEKRSSCAKTPGQNCIYSLIILFPPFAFPHCVTSQAPRIPGSLQHWWSGMFPLFLSSSWKPATCTPYFCSLTEECLHVGVKIQTKDCLVSETFWTSAVGYGEVTQALTLLFQIHANFHIGPVLYLSSGNFCWFFAFFSARYGLFSFAYLRLGTSSTLAFQHLKFLFLTPTSFQRQGLFFRCWDQWYPRIRRYSWSVSPFASHFVLWPCTRLSWTPFLVGGSSAQRVSAIAAGSLFSMVVTGWIRNLPFLHDIQKNSTKNCIGGKRRYSWYLGQRAACSLGGLMPMGT